jgi:hypothetical protein
MASKGGCKVNTPDWSKAPEGATHWGPDNANWYGVWTKKRADGWQGWIDGKWQAQHHLPEIRANQMIPIPTQWRGPQDGLPPVNCEVKIRLGHDWFAAKVIAHGFDHRGPVAVFQAIDWIAIRNNEDDGVRPIQSDRDRAIEEIASDISSYGFGYSESANMSLAEQLFNAGYRKT